MPLGPFLWRHWQRLPHRLTTLLLLSFGLAQAQSGPFTGIVNLGALLNSTTPVSVSAPVFANGASGPRADFHLSIRYAGAAQGWLSVSPTSGTTPQNVVITANPSNLPAGTYLAQVLADVGVVNGSPATTVALTVAPGGVNPAGLAASPSALVFLPDALDPQTISVTTAPGVPGPVAFRSFATSTGWLSIAQSDQGNGSTVKVQVDPTGLRPGLYSGTVTITTATQNNTVVPVSLVIPQGGLTSTIVLTPAQQSLTFNYKTGTSFNPSQTVFVSSGSTQYTNYTATTSDAWLRVSAASWLSPSRSTPAFAPGLLYVSVDPTGLSAGSYNGKVTFSVNGSNVDVPVTLNISPTAVLNADPSFVSIDATTNQLTSNVAVTASDSFYFTALTSANSSWLSVTPNSGIVSNNIINLTVTARPDGLPAGTYHGSITLVGPGGSPTLVVPVQLTVSGTAASSGMSLAPNALTFWTVAGDPIPPQYVVDGTSTSTSESYAVSAVSDGGWFTVDPLLGATPLTAKVTVNPATPAGTYSGTITVTSLTRRTQGTVKVTFTSTARIMKAAPGVVTFTQAFSAPPPASQEVQITANALSTFRVTTQPTWIKALPAGPVTTPAKLVLTADPTGMAPGNYEGSVRLSGPNIVTIQVLLTIDAPPPAAISPSSVQFAYALGSPDPPPQSVSIKNPAVTTTFAAVPATASGVNWLMVTPASGSTPGAISLSVNTDHLTPGQHAGTVTVTFGDSGIAPITIAVTLTVTGTPVQVREIWNAATLAPTTIAPGQIVTLTGLGLGPSTAAVARPTPAGAYTTDLAGVRVFFDGMDAPLLLAQENQINAIVPYAVFGRASARVQVQVGSNYSVPIDVKVASAAPGIFTLGSSGRGPAAALNTDASLNSILNPAERGSIVVVYITGEGQTDPPGQDGRVITADLRKPLGAVTASIGGRSAEVLYAGSAPNQVAGLCQVNIRVPDDVNPGAQPIEIRIGGNPTQAGVTVAIR